MVIPIPSKNKRFVITIGIKGLAPALVGIVLYDPTVRNADYLRRKVTFSAQSLKSERSSYREIQIPVPVSPKRLVLEVYNKETGDEYGFEITKFDMGKLPTLDIWSSPERHRFMDFAIRFAQRAGHARPGFYQSPDHEFLIQYLPTIRDSMGIELVTPARIHKQMPRVQISQKMFKQFSIPVRVAILSHEGCHYFMNTRSEKNADLCGIQYYLDYGFPTIEAVYAATKVFKRGAETSSVSKVHLKRTADIINFIDDYKKLKAS
ncbi:MAG: hypothetical protein JXQ90_18435 [Cyclobacteriaceae bacterium]